jgi:hypothetical protein
LIVVLKSFEDLLRLCQARYLNGQVINFEFYNTNNNAIFYYEQERKIEIKYDPDAISRSKNRQ